MKPCNYVTPHFTPTNVPSPRSDPRSDSYLHYVYMRHPSILPLFPSFFFSSTKNSIIRQFTTYIYNTYAYFERYGIGYG